MLVAEEWQERSWRLAPKWSGAPGCDKGAAVTVASVMCGTGVVEKVGFVTCAGELVGQMWANFGAGCLFLATKMLPKWKTNPETVTLGSTSGHGEAEIRFWLIF